MHRRCWLTCIVDLGHLREDYQTIGIDIDDVSSDPIEQFEKWFGEVQEAGIWEPNAMVLSSLTPEGFPASRNVLLKAVDGRGFVFYTNYESEKGTQLIANAKSALTFSWIELRRQVRVTGRAELLAPDESDRYFASRPRGSQLGAWASPQSQVVADRAELDDHWRKLEARFEGQEVPRPSHWGGFLVRPSVIEFWQGRPNRMHDRLRYTATNSDWQIDRLAP